MGARSSRNTTQNNRSDGHLLEYFRNTFVRGGGGTNPPLPSGLIATGGVISDYTDGPAVYRAHIFTSSGTFSVTAPGGYGDTVDAFVVAGGGGGSGGFPGYGPGRGGGAGGAFVVTTYPVSINTYPISVGAGGAGAKTGPVSNPFATGRGSSGGNSTFTNPTPQVLTAAGGGGGGDYDAPSAVAPVSSGGPGGCGGGGGGYPGAPAPNIAGGTTTQPSQNPGVSNLTNYGFAGGTGDNTTAGGGGAGGGTGGVGDNYSAPTNTLRSGGSGIPITYAYGPLSPVTYGAGGPTGGPNTGPTVDATYSSGNGGMGWLTNPAPSKGGNGGSGIVVVRYQIASLTAVQKATGGAISFASGKTIHQFLSSGTFTVTNPTLTSVDYLVVAGGGGGGGIGQAGGGGAGGFRTNVPGHPLAGSAFPVSITPGVYPVSVGAGGAGGTKGIDSVLTSPIAPQTITSTGGGYGSSFPTPGGGPGGSGGGSANTSAGPDLGGISSPVTSPAQGFAGGDAPGYTNNYFGGGGGGATAVGSNGPAIAPGGAGSPISISGITTHYAGGGGGGGNQSYFTTDSVGGAGGGGAGSGGQTPHPVYGFGGVPGTQSTGGGGGGSSYPTPASSGGNGGSGIVIIAYPS